MTRWFAPSASWNRPASELGRAVGYDDYPRRLLRHGGGPTCPAPVMIEPHFRDYSIPVYDISEATTTARCYQLNWARAQQSFIAAEGVTIPWNPAWQGAPGNDGSLIIVDEAKSKAWELWGMVPSVVGCLNWSNIVAILFGGGTKIGAASVNVYSNLRDGRDGTVTSIARGMGIHKAAGLVRASEVIEGRIGHAMSMLVSNPMFGPNMVSPQTDGTKPGAGTTHGFYCKPATRLEHRDPKTLTYGGVTTAPATTENRAKSIPSGMRFAIDITDAQIEAWLDSRKYRDKLRTTARIFAVALRDYGVMVGDTSGYGVSIECDGLVNPITRYEWAQAGIVDVTTSNPYPFRDLLAGLITEANLYVVAQPS